MSMTTRLFFQQPRRDLKRGLRFLGLLCGAAPSLTLAATLHAIILADTNDSSLHADKDRDNLKQLVANVRDATGLELQETVIDGKNGFGQGSYEQVKNLVAGLPVMAKEDVVIFYYTGHGVNKDTDSNSKWPAMDVEGEGTAPDKLIKLSWVKQTLSAKSPRLLIAIADTCNAFLSEPSRGEGTLGEVGPYKQAYRKLFLGYQGVIMASGSIPEQDSFSNQEGGRFTQAFLTSLQGELKSADPDWKKIAAESVKEIPVENPVDARDQPVQTPQMEVAVVKSVTEGGEEEEENGSHILSQPPLKLDETVCPQQTSGWGACYLNVEAEGGKKWSVFVEEKVWFTTWQGWEQAQPLADKSEKSDGTSTYPQMKGADHFVSLTTDPTLVSILTLGYRYDKLSVGVSLLPKKSYNFPIFTREPVEWQHTEESKDAEGKPLNDAEGKPLYTYTYENSNEQVTASAEREELDVTVGYSILPELQVGVGFKRVRLDYQYSHYSDNPFSDVPKGESWNDESNYKTYGLSLNLGGQTCLANWLGADISMFGNFSYGALKTTWTDGNSDYATYHSTDLGLSWGLPKAGQIKPEVRFGYRAQTLYTQVSIGDAVDTTEGFTLGLRVTY